MMPLILPAGHLLAASALQRGLAAMLSPLGAFRIAARGLGACPLALRVGEGEWQSFCLGVDYRPPITPI